MRPAGIGTKDRQLKYPSVINRGINGSQLLDGTAGLSPRRFTNVSVRFVWHTAKEAMLGAERENKKWCKRSMRNVLFKDAVTC